MIDLQKRKEYRKEWRKKWRQKPENMKKEIAQRKEYHLKHKKESGEKCRLYRLKKMFNMTNEDYEKLLIKQNGLCAICFKEETSKNGNTIKKLAVDHCHKTGKVRGLLCNRCNIAIGMLEDDPLLLESAKNFLCQK